ncbi:MAG: DNA repair protein RecN [Actinomycetes bacterium]
MIEQLRIVGLGVIEESVLDLAPGFNVVTGETGDGKTMVVTGLGLLLGQRADAALVRSGCPRATVEGVLSVPASVARRVQEAGGRVDDDQLVLVRSVSAEGRSRAHVGGASAPVGLLGELADQVVAVHGQSDQQRLLSAPVQRETLDRYGGPSLLAVRDRYTAQFHELRSVDAELTTLVDQVRERDLEAEALRFGLAEIHALAPQPGEDLALVAEAQRLGHSDALRDAALSAHRDLVGDDAATRTDAVDAVALVSSARRGLEAVQQHDETLRQLAQRVADAAYALADVAAELGSYADSVDADPSRLAWVEERRAALAAVTRKHGPTIDDVLGWADRARPRLEQLEGSQDRIAELTARRDDLAASLGLVAAELSRAREAAASTFGRAVTSELVELAMPHAVASAVVRQRTAPAGLVLADGRTVDFGPLGVDEVELQLSAHPGAPALALQKGASGGELSRVMLAVEVVFSDADPVGTFVFDEVDAGVGGQAAIEVGRRLARLARNRQVLVVTHLPQVAAFADRHFVVAKSDDGSVTASGVRAVTETERPAELSRMLAGLADSPLGQAHATELLDLAAVERRPARAARAARRSPKS